MQLKKFIIKLAILISMLISTYLFFVDKLAKGFVDPYYNKFTQESGGLILGLSRASEGISPKEIEKYMSHLNFEKPIVNFAIDLNNTPYSKIYLNSIKEKLKPKLSNGLFILSITPGAFLAPKNMSNNSIEMLDSRGIIGKVTNFTSSPNYDYIINTYPMPLYNALGTFSKWEHFHDHTNGWIEIRLISKKDTIKEKDIKQWKANTLNMYKRKMKSLEVSKYRIDCFNNIVEFLKTKGDVFFVRMPYDIEMQQLENNIWEGFDRDFDSISKIYGVPYFNYSKKSNKYKTYDGSHLESESAKKFTRQLSNDIKIYLKSNSL